MEEDIHYIYERYVFDADNSYGYAKPREGKTLEALGIELSDWSKKLGKNNNRKMTHDKICSDLFMKIYESKICMLTGI